jgi:ATP-dependent RNA circularization protein (DNA/RNA ligase family)
MKTSLPPFIKYPKIALYEEHPDILKNEVMVFEKLDGGNCQFRKLITGRILCGNRSNYLNEKYFNRYWFMDFLRWVHRNYSLFVIEPKYIFYGEWLAPHTLEYAKEFQNRFYLIDIFDTEVEKFLEYPRSCELIQEYQLKDINLLNPFTGKLNEKELDNLLPGSDYGAEQKEGIVIKDYANQRFVKLVNPKFKEQNESVFITLTSPIEAVARRYVTQARINKAIETARCQGFDTLRTQPKGLKINNVRDNIEQLVHILFEDIKDEYRDYNRHKGMTETALKRAIKQSLIREKPAF